MRLDAFYDFFYHKNGIITHKTTHLSFWRPLENQSSPALFDARDGVSEQPDAVYFFFAGAFFAAGFFAVGFFVAGFFAADSLAGADSAFDL